jgi:hypothetical protein
MIAGINEDYTDNLDTSDGNTRTFVASPSMSGDKQAFIVLTAIQRKKH